MNDGFKLTFGEPAAPDTPIEVAAERSEAKNELSIDSLPEGDRQMVRDFVQKIDILDSNAISSYGSDSQNKLAAFSDSVLNAVKTKDAGEAGKMLTELVVEINNFDTETGEKKGGFFGLFQSAKNSMQRIQANYAKVDTNVDKITTSLEGHRRTLLKDIAMMDEMYTNNYQYYRELTLYIVAGKEKLNDTNSQVIPALRKKAEESKDEIDAQKLNDAVQAANRFEKRLHDLSLSRIIAIQMAPQIRLIQNNDSALVDKIQSSIANAIPLWKNQIVIACSLANAKNALEAQTKVSELTNQLLLKNSEMLKQGSLEIASESERSIVAIDTVQKTNQNLIDTINGVIDIQRKGHETRVAAEQQLVDMEQQFKQALLESGKRQAIAAK